MKKNTAALTLICFGVIILSLFLPFYEGPRTDGLIAKDSFAVSEIYYSPEFGLTLWVFNGFGSVFAGVNVFIAIILLLSRFFFPKSLLTAISMAVAFVISLAMLIYSTSDLQGEALADEMMIGFYLMLISQVVLIAQSFTKAITEPPKERRHDPDLLDY